MNEKMPSDNLTETTVAVAEFDPAHREEALDKLGEVVQEFADHSAREFSIVKPDGEVVAKVFPAPRTKAFSFVGLKDPGGDSKAADYFAIFHHEDFKGEDKKTND